MLEVNVFSSDVTTPTAATQGERERHTVVVIATISQAMGLIYHDPADIDRGRQLDNPVFSGGVNATRMSAPVYVCDRIDRV